MNEKDFKRLSKSDLINIIYQMKETEEELRQQLDEAETRLKDRTLKLENAGSIAEAALSINEVFADAQKAADDYLNQIRADNAEAETRCAAMLQETADKCKLREEESIARCKAREDETELKCKNAEQQTEQEVAQKWEAFHQKARDYISTHAELANLLQLKEN